MVLVDAAMLPAGSYESDDPDFADLDTALDRHERTLMELVYGYLAAGAERDGAVKAEPAVEYATM